MPQNRASNRLTAKRLREVLNYDPETGIFTFRITRGSLKVGKRVGCIRGGTRSNGGGYRVIRVDYRLYRAAPLAWLYMTGRWPTLLVDHKDTNRQNDVFDNLRLATKAQNNINGGAHAHNILGIRGVGFDKSRGKYKAQLVKNDKAVLNKRFDTLEEAIAARNAAVVKHFGEFARLS